MENSMAQRHLSSQLSPAYAPETSGAAPTTGGIPAALSNLAPQAQTSSLKVFKSIERPVMTPVYGTSAPPRGLSGQMRAFAYRFSEAQLAHWMTLLAADRVDVVEGIIDDLKKGHIPNIFAEMGLGAELKYNRPALIKKALIGAGILVAGAYLLKAPRLLKRGLQLI